MPNECCSSLTVTGATSEQTQRILAAVERDELAQEFVPQPDWQATPNEDGICPGPQYFTRHTHTRWVGGPLRVEGSRYPDGSYDQRWYGWNSTAWGTKWGAYQADASVSDDGTVDVFFTTAWSPLSEGWFQAMSEEMPQAEIICTYYEPGCDFYGVIRAVDGIADSITRSYSDLRDDWISKNYTEEELAAYEENEDDDLVDRLNDAWYDVEGDELDADNKRIIDELKGRYSRDFKDRLMGHDLEELLLSLSDDGSILVGTWKPAKQLQAMDAAGYLLPIKGTDEEREAEFQRQAEMFKAEVGNLSLHVSQIVKEMMEASKAKAATK